jgi:integrase
MTRSKLQEPNLKYAVAKAIREKRTARMSDGEGLTLVVNAAGSAKWVHRYAFRGRTPERTLGNYPALGLADARIMRNGDRELIAQEKNPVDVYAAGQTAAVPTFAEFCTIHFMRLAPPEERKLPMARSRWFIDMTIRAGNVARLPVDDVRVTDIEQVVRPMWNGPVCPPKAARIVAAIARVLDFRVALENPNADPEDSVWSATLLKRLKRRLGDDPHHTINRASMPYDAAPAMWARLTAEPAMSARVLEWVLLTGVRAQEAAGATWSEIDWRARTWTVPASRRKSHKNKGPAGKPFVVPLSLCMVQCLRRARAGRETDFGPDDLIFPSYGPNYSDPVARRLVPAWTKASAYSNHAILAQTRKFGEPGQITTHGFRSTILAWGVAVPHRARDPFPLEVMDRVLSHTPKDEKVSSVLPAYLGQTDPFMPRRRIVMREWSAYLRGRPYSPRPAKAAPDRQDAPALRLVA